MAYDVVFHDTADVEWFDTDDVVWVKEDFGGAFDDERPAWRARQPVTDDAEIMEIMRVLMPILVKRYWT